MQRRIWVALCAQCLCPAKASEPQRLGGLHRKQDMASPLGRVDSSASDTTLIDSPTQPLFPLPLLWIPWNKKVFPARFPTANPKSKRHALSVHGLYEKGAQKGWRPWDTAAAGVRISLLVTPSRAHGTFPIRHHPNRLHPTTSLLSSMTTFFRPHAHTHPLSYGWTAALISTVSLAPKHSFALSGKRLLTTAPLDLLSHALLGSLIPHVAINRRSSCPTALPMSNFASPPLLALFLLSVAHSCGRFLEPFMHNATVSNGNRPWLSHLHLVPCILTQARANNTWRHVVAEWS